MIGRGEARARPPITVDLAETSIRDFNRRLHALPHDTTELAWKALNPRGAHAIAAGLARPVEVEIVGAVGYYCAGMNKGGRVIIRGRCGWGVAEAILAGTVRVKGDAGEGAAATGKGGHGAVEGDAGARCGISMKGVDIVVAGSVGARSAYMAQHGNLVVCGDAGGELGEAVHGADIYVQGRVESLGEACAERKMTRSHLKVLEALLARAGMKADPAKFRRYGPLKPRRRLVKPT